MEGVQVRLTKINQNNKTESAIQLGGSYGTRVRLPLHLGCGIHTCTSGRNQDWPILTSSALRCLRLPALRRCCTEWSKLGIHIVNNKRFDIVVMVYSPSSLYKSSWTGRPPNLQPSTDL